MTTVKDKGNAEFKLGNWIEAIKFYTEGINEDPEGIESVILYSNRSAAYVKRCEYDRAILDAQTCVDLNPKWSKSYLRLAEAYVYLRDFKLSKHNYFIAITLAESGDIKIRYQQAAQRIDILEKRTFEEVTSLRNRNQGLDGNLDVSEILASGNGDAVEVPKFGITAAKHFQLTITLTVEALSCISFSLENNLDVDMAHKYLVKVTDSILYAANSYRSLTDETARHILMAMNHLASSSVFNYAQFKDPFSPVTKVIQYYDNIIKRDGNWNFVRESLDCLIRSVLLDSQILRMDDKTFEKGHYRVAYIIDLIQRGRMIWEGVEESSRGFVFSTPFLHGVMSLLVQDTSKGVRLALTPNIFSREKLRTYATFLTQDTNPIRKDETPSFNLAFCILPKCTGFAALGNLEYEDAHENTTTDKYGNKYLGEKQLLNSIKYHRLAAKCSPEDSYEHWGFLYNALYSEIAAGEKSIRYLFDTAAEAERSWSAHDRWAGPNSVPDQQGNLDSRSILRGGTQLMLHKARGWLMQAEQCKCSHITREMWFNFTMNRPPINAIKGIPFTLFQRGKEDPLTIEEELRAMTIKSHAGKPCPNNRNLK